MRHTRTFVALAALSSFLPACEEKAPPPPPRAATPGPAPEVKPASAPAAAALGSAISALGLKFVVPAGWKQVPPANSMRLAEIQVPDVSGDAARACTIAFSTAGGDVQSNIDRWTGQVKDAAGQPAKPKSETRTIAGVNVTIVELGGSYAGMGETGPHSDWVLRGAIVETPNGLLFIKMTGPSEQMAGAAAAFSAMIDGLEVH